MSNKLSQVEANTCIFAAAALITARELATSLEAMPLEARIAVLNEVRSILHAVSPFKSEPVDFVRWVPFESVEANDYNPNSVAPPEMELLRLSVEADGYTQPIVSWPSNGGHEVVDGFHRNRVGREVHSVRDRLHGHLPIVSINEQRHDKGDRIASTIRHNRARGKHRIDSMSEIVVDLRRRNWSPAKIGRELGMDQDEVLRLCQISGLTEMFANADFSEAWEADHLDDTDYRTDLSPVLDVGGNIEPDVAEAEGPGLDVASGD